MVKVRKSLIGMIFDRLTVLAQAEDYIRPSDGAHCAQWLCECNCQSHNKIVVLGTNLTQGNVKSCGCLSRENSKKRLSGNSYGKKLKKYNKYVFLDDIVIGTTLKGEEFQFSIQDYDTLKNYCWRIDAKGYVVAKDSETKKIVKMHKLIMKDVDEKLIDHANRKKTDNTRDNLRIVTSSENAYNHSIGKNNKSGIIGVIWHNRDLCWEAYISINHQRLYLGRYSNKTEAIKARLRAELKYFGKEFAPQRHLFEEYEILLEDKEE